MGIFWGVIVTCALIVIGATWWGASTYLNSRALATGPTTEGVVLDRSERNSEDGTTWTISYRFTPPGGSALEKRVDADTHLAERLREGGAVTIRYLPNRPEVNAIDGNLSPNVWRLVFAGVLTFAALFVIGALLRSQYG
ncbi:MAG: hypothetical protein ACI9MR_001167 [Myxococcota bacterium]